MKRLLLPVLLLLVAPAAWAQVLPTPGARNPDWTLTKTDPPCLYGYPDTLRYHADPMPNKAANMSTPTDHMPNAVHKSISGIGNRRYYWDAARRLRYEWQVKSGSEAPDGAVTVRDDNAGIAYIFRRRPTPLSQPFYTPGQPKPSK